MKSCTIFIVSVLVLITIPTTSFGQNNNKEVVPLSRDLKTLEQPKSISLSNHTTTESQNSEVKSNTVQTISVGTRRVQPSIDEKILSLDDRINAIDVKVEHVSSDQTLNQRAIDQNWFEQMATIRLELVNEREELKAQKTK